MYQLGIGGKINKGKGYDSPIISSEISVTFQLLNTQVTNKSWKKSHPIPELLEIMKFLFDSPGLHSTKCDQHFSIFDNASITVKPKGGGGGEGGAGICGTFDFSEEFLVKIPTLGPQALVKSDKISPS